MNDALNDYKRVLKLVYHEYANGPIKELLEHYANDFILPSIAYFRGIQIRDDSWYSFYIGLALGVITLVFLILNPGEAYDISDEPKVDEKENETSKAKSKKKKSKNKKRNKIKEDENQRPKDNNDKIIEDDKTIRFEHEDEDEDKIKLSDVDAEATSFLKGLMKMTKEYNEANTKAVDEATSFLLGVDGDKSKKFTKKKDRKKLTDSSNEMKDDENKDEEEEEEEEINMDGIKRDPFEDPNIKKKARKAAQLFGLSEKQFDKAMNNAKIEFETGVAPPSEYDTVANFAGLLNIGILLGVTVGCVWAVNKDYDNFVTKMFVANFPREAKFLGVKWPGGAPISSVFDSKETVTDLLE